jgi:hypothetical protein
MRNMSLVMENMSKPNGRYRINFFGGLPATEKYTSDLKGALEAGLKLASTRNGPPGSFQISWLGIAGILVAYAWWSGASLINKGERPMVS